MRANWTIQGDMHLVIGLKIQSLSKQQTKKNLNLYNLTIKKQTMVTIFFVFYKVRNNNL